MKRGFTLIELLGVMIILALLVILTFPNIINFIKSSSEKNDNMNLNLIYNATDLYIKENKNDFPKVNGNSYCITLQDLVDNGGLKSPIILSNSNDDITNLKSVQVNYQDKFTYELKDNDKCIENINNLD